MVFTKYYCCFCLDFFFFSFSKGFKAAHVFNYALLRNKASLKNG